MDAPHMRPRTVGEMLDAGISLYLRNARTLLGIAACVVVPVQVVIGLVYLSVEPSGAHVPGDFVFRGVHQQSAGLGGTVVDELLGLIMGVLVTAACVKAVSDTYLDQAPSIGTSLRFALRRLPALVALYIVQTLVLIIAFVALIIPGIWLYAAWSVPTPAMMLEGSGPWRSLRRSRQLVRRRWWPTAGLLLSLNILAQLVAQALRALLSGLDGFSSHPGLVPAVIATVLGGIVASVVTQPAIAAVTTVLYYDLRVRKEGFDLQLLADHLGLPAPEPVLVGEPLQPGEWPTGPESVGRPGGPPFWPPPPGWRPPGPSPHA
jgi:hypothetical protein